MGRIYKESSFAIAAEAATDSQAGIFECSKRHRSKLANIEVPYFHLNGTTGKMFIQRLLDSPAEAKGPLSQRAWTLQEEVLPPRTLRFAAQQTWWRCREVQCNERDRRGLFPESRWSSHNVYQLAIGRDRAAFQAIARFGGLDKQSPRRQGLSIQSQTQNIDVRSRLDVLATWHHIVNDFAVRKMTYNKDKLPAISGLAREIKRIAKGKYSYKAGIWDRTGFEFRDLLWSIGVPGGAKYEEYIAPSWIWASIDLSKAKNTHDAQSCLYNEVFLKSLEPKAEITSMFTRTIADDPFMQVLSGSVYLEGMCCHVCSCNIPDVFFDLHDGFAVRALEPWNDTAADRVPNFSSTQDTDPDIFRDFSKALAGRRACNNTVVPPEHRLLLLIEVAEWTCPRGQGTARICLILRLCENRPAGKSRKYERLGRAFVLTDLSESWRSSRWQNQKVTII